MAACATGDSPSHAIMPLAAAIRVVALRVARHTRARDPERGSTAASAGAHGADPTTVAQLRRLRWRARAVARAARSVERTIAHTGPDAHVRLPADTLAGAAEELARLTLWVQTLRAPRRARGRARFDRIA
jgi:hypothetical protein